MGGADCCREHVAEPSRSHASDDQARQPSRAAPTRAATHQSQLGNAIVARALAPAAPRDPHAAPDVDGRIRVLPPDSPQEQEAHRIADGLMEAPAPATARTGGIQRMCADCEAAAQHDHETSPEREGGAQVSQETPLAAAAEPGAVPTVTPEVERGVRELPGRGERLPPRVRTHFERRFGRSLGGVRVHHDAHANRLAGAVHARAFTTGNHVVFAGGEFAPETHAGQRLLAHELTHVVQQGAAPSGNMLQRDPGPDPPPPPPPPTPQEEAATYWQEEFGKWIDETADDSLDKDERAKAYRVVLLMEKQKVDFADTEAAVDALIKIEATADDEDATLRVFGTATAEPMETFPGGFPKAWSRRIRDELSLADIAPGLEQAAHQARDNRDAVAARIKPYVLENGLPVPFKWALTMRYFPLIRAYARGNENHIVNEFARVAIQYGIAQIPWDFVVQWDQFVDMVAKSVIDGDSIVDFESYKAFRNIQLGRVRHLSADVQTGFSKSIDANEPAAINFPLLSLGMALGSILRAVSNVKDSWAESERMWAAGLAGADQEIAGHSGLERMAIGETWAMRQGYSLDAAAKIASDLADELPETFAKGAGLALANTNPITGIIADLYVLWESAKDLYNLAEELSDATDRVTSAETVVDLQREIAQLELVLASAQLRIALDIAALKAAGEGLKAKGAKAYEAFKGEGGAIEQAGREIRAQTEVLERTHGKTDGNSLTTDELQTELDVARRSPVRRVNQAEYDAEIDIGNDHTWKHERESGFWCRFSPGPPKCVPSLEGETTTAKKPTVDPKSPAGPAATKLFDPVGKFADLELEAAYERYIKRKTARSQPYRDRLGWKEARDYFWSDESPIARGNKFNKARRKAYPHNEVTLENGKRVDSYVEDQEIVSRKATDFDDLDADVFRAYLREFKNKYKPGLKITAHGGGLTGKVLKGEWVLEVPDTNIASSNRLRFEMIADAEGVAIRYAPEP